MGQFYYFSIYRQSFDVKKYQRDLYCAQHMSTYIKYVCKYNSNLFVTCKMSLSFFYCFKDDIDVIKLLLK